LLALLGPSNIGYLTSAELRDTDPLLDPLITASLLAYGVAHFRLLGLTRNVLPVDLRALTPTQPGRRLVRGKPQPRPPEAVARTEWAGLLLAVPLWTAVGFIAWMLLRDQESPLEEYTYDLTRGQQEFRDALWQAILVLWLAVLGLLLASAVLGYLRRLRA